MGNLPLSSGCLFANRFEIQCTAGSGGMGTVYRAMDRYNGNIVALKLLNSDRGNGSIDEGERFLREAQLLSELRHPGIVAHVAHGRTPDAQRFLAMEWLEGTDLSARLARGPLSVQDCLRLFERVADALSVAHQRGIIHRDLKPSNLFLVGGDVDRVKLLDFGIARRLNPGTTQAMTRTGMVIGTPEYMAPEQARGSRDLTPAADLFSLGCVLYECLTGQPPFVADHIAAVLVQILFEEPLPVGDRRPGVPTALSALLARLLAKHPAQRLADAAALRSELAGLGELPESALTVTMANPKPQAVSFADQEQNLFSIVLAAAAEEEAGFGVTQSKTAAHLASMDRQALMQALAALGGMPDLLANGFLVVTVPPQGSAQDQAAVAARAGLLIKARWPDAVVAMATGRGAVRGRTAVGEVVELAARSLQSKGAPDAEKPRTGVLIDPLSAKLLAGRFAQTPQPGGAVLLQEEWDVDVSRPLLGKPMPCVGREAELASMESQVAACFEESEARGMLCTAPPGIGKSRLRHEFMHRLEKRSEPITLLLGRGDMTNAGAPYGILRRAIRHLCEISGSESLETQQDRLRSRVRRNLPRPATPATTAAAAGDEERIVAFVGELCNVQFPAEGRPMLQAARQDPKLMRDSLRRALLDFLAAECCARPVLLLLDDLQWGDELTVSLIDEALHEQAGSTFFVLAFARPEVFETFPRLWTGHKLQQLSLKGLSKKACGRLIRQALGDEVDADAVAHAIEHSAGNALFLEELIRAIAEGKSAGAADTVVAMLQARLSRLNSNLRRTIRAASIFGQTFWSGGAAALLGSSCLETEVAGWLAELVSAELIQPHAQSRLHGQVEYGFRHALVRDATYGLLTEHDLRAGHRLAGEFLMAAGEREHAVIADHLYCGGDKARAAGFYLLAAEAALEQGDYVGGSRHVETGVGCAVEGELLGRLCGVASALGLSQNRHEHLRRDSELAMKLLPAGSRGWCRALLGALWVAMHDRESGRIPALVAALLAAEPELDAQVSYLEAIMDAGIPLAWMAPESLLRTLYQRIIEIVAKAELTNPTIRRYQYAFRCTLQINREPRPWSLLCDAEIWLALCKQAGDKKWELTIHTHVSVWGWIELGDLEGHCQRMTAMESVILKQTDRRIVRWWLSSLIWAFCERGDAESLSKAEYYLTLMQKDLGDSAGPASLIQISFFTGWIELCRGEFSAAATHIERSMVMFQVTPIVAMSGAALQLQALLGLGRLKDAVGLAEQVLAALSKLGCAGIHEVPARLAVSETLYASGDLTRARVELQETLRQIQLRADDITDPLWKNSYLTRNRSCVRVQSLARDWGLNAVIK